MCSFLKVIPYKLNPVTEQVEIFTRRGDKLLWMCNILAEFSYAAFIYFRFYELMTTKSLEELNKIHLAIHIAWTAGISMVVVGHISLFHRRRELCTFINSLFLFIQNLEKSPVRRNRINSSHQLDIIQLFLQVNPFPAWFTVWTNFFTVFFFPSSPQFVTSLFNPELRESWPILIIFGLIDYFLVLCIWKLSFFISGIMLLYLKIASTIVSEIG